MKILLIAVIALASISARADMSNWCVEVSQTNTTFYVQPRGWYNLADIPTMGEINPITGDVRLWFTQAGYKVVSTNGVTQAALSNQVVAARTRLADMDNRLEKLTKAFALVVLDEINIVRSSVTSNTNLPARTAAQLKAAVAAKYQTLP